MSDFFISYTKADLSWAKWIARQLTDAGFTVTYQAQDFRPGGNFVLEMQRGLVESQRVIAVLSPNYLSSRFALAEWAAAFAQDPTGEKGILVPIRVRECDLEGLHVPIIYQDLVGLDEDEARAALLDGIRREPVATTTPVPFPGAASRTQGEPQRFPGDLPPIWNVPHLRNPLFTGRTDVLSALEPEAEPENRDARVRYRAIHGLGGIGKTELAVEAAYRFSTEYEIVWWLRSEDGTALLSDYIALGKALGAPEAEQADQPAAVEAIRRRLEQSRERRMLIFDNAVQAAQLLPYLPRAGNGDVLITSRNPEWISVAESVPLDVLSELEAIEFLLNRTEQTDEGAAAALARELGYLPLALAQAAAYAAATGMTLARYLELFQEHHRELLARGDLNPAYPDTVATAWELSFQLVASESPAARDLLNLMAFFAPNDIPLTLLTDHADILPEPLATAVKDVIPLEDAKALLRRLSLVEIAADEELSLHRLVQMVTRDRLEIESQRAWATTAIRIVRAAFPDAATDVDGWPTCERLLAHTQTVTDYAQELDVGAVDTAGLLNQSGLYLMSRARFGEARSALERALAINETILDPNDPVVANSLGNLAHVLQEHADFAGAQAAVERALAIDEAAFGPHSLAVAADLSNLAQIVRRQGDLRRARALLERALTINEAWLGPSVPIVTTSLNNLANVLLDLGDLTRARELLERALTIDKAAFGPDHPEVATKMNNLATVLGRQGDVARAEQMCERALAIHTRLLGPEHPIVAMDLNNLAGLVREQGDLDRARQLLEQALLIDEAAYGLGHPNVAFRLMNLGHAKQAQGDLLGARRSFERAMEINEQAFGPENSVVATNLNELATVLRAQGDLSGARRTLQRALSMWRRIGDDESAQAVLRILRGIDEEHRARRR